MPGVRPAIGRCPSGGRQPPGPDAAARLARALLTAGRSRGDIRGSPRPGWRAAAGGGDRHRGRPAGPERGVVREAGAPGGAERELAARRALLAMAETERPAPEAPSARRTGCCPIRSSPWRGSGARCAASKAADSRAASAADFSRRCGRAAGSAATGSPTRPLAPPVAMLANTPAARVVGAFPVELRDSIHAGFGDRAGAPPVRRGPPQAAAAGPLDRRGGALRMRIAARRPRSRRRSRPLIDSGRESANACSKHAARGIPGWSARRGRERRAGRRRGRRP
jgi:hypothetical protein